MNCSCVYCQNLDYDNSEFFVDMSFLKKERPLGVSGLMRVKNEADFVALSIDSCIGALDELIIVYQDCDDNSPEIIEQKRRQYPDKIKVFHYRPKVLSHNLSKEEFEYASKLPHNSIHLLSNYYNYTLSKATYRYALKIDADQIYFSEKLKNVCDAYRSTSKPSLSFGEVWARWHVYFMAAAVNIFPWILDKIKFLVPKENTTRKYWSGALKSIAHYKNPLILSGINIFYADKKWQVPTGSELGSDIFPPFNGIGDTVIFKISPQTYYMPQKLDKNEVVKYQNCFIETFTDSKNLIIYKNIYKTNVLYGGFIWYHAALLKKVNYFNNVEKYKTHNVAFDEMPDYCGFEKKFGVKFRRWMRLWYCMFWQLQQKKIPQNFMCQMENIIQNY